jgi:hypothetical protein
MRNWVHNRPYCNKIGTNEPVPVLRSKDFTSFSCPWIRIHKVIESGSNSDPDPQPWRQVMLNVCCTSGNSTAAEWREEWAGWRRHCLAEICFCQGALDLSYYYRAFPFWHFEWWPVKPGSPRILLRLGFKLESEFERSHRELPSSFRDPDHFRSRSGFLTLIWAHRK